MTTTKSEKIRVVARKIELILFCEECEEVKFLQVGGDDEHSLVAANFIADEFDKFHDENCEE